VQLTLLPINQLETIYANNNSLTFFDYAHLNPQTLTELDISNNNLSETDITVFSSLINLVNLRIGSKDESVLNGQRNKFYGSLSSLQNLTKLKSLGISNTDIDSGLEYLSENLEEFYYSSFFFGFGKLENTLKDQVFASETYDPDN
jgi:Leucine-rich repeat (LRR) protein